jgi:hypothetical protein
MPSIKESLFLIIVAQVVNIMARKKASLKVVEFVTILHLLQ